MVWVMMYVPRAAVRLCCTAQAGKMQAGSDVHLTAGVLLDKTDSWDVIFGVVAAVYALGFAGFAAWGSGELQHYDD